MQQNTYKENFLLPSPNQDFSHYVSNNRVTCEGITAFAQTIYDYYKHHGRIFAWRNIQNPYYVVVSEIMLQQTQTHRTREKYEQFISTFVTVQSLATASLKDVLAAWQGLGYNRRAQSLHLFAQRVVAEFGGRIPDDPLVLVTFKGIGPATASSICAFAFNKPTVFIETNIRTVFIHCFFKNKAKVTDAEILPLVEQTLDRKQPCSWYYALMDYGVMLKKLYGNPNKKSAHYAVQSKFEGSNRQIRGAILKLLLEHNSLSLDALIFYLQKEPQRVATIAQDLLEEKLIEFKSNMFSLPM